MGTLSTGPMLARNRLRIARSGLFSGAPESVAEWRSKLKGAAPERFPNPPARFVKHPPSCSRLYWNDQLSLSLQTFLLLANLEIALDAVDYLAALSNDLADHITLEWVALS